MDISLLLDKFVAVLGAVGSLAWVVQRIYHANKQDKKDKELDRQHWETWIMEQVKANSEDAMANMRDKYDDLKSDFNDLAKDKDEMEKQYLSQIALKEEENKNLRVTNDALRKENATYRAKYGEL